MPIYRINKGHRHHMSVLNKTTQKMEAVAFTAGQKIELSESSAKPFLDKLEYIGESDTEKLSKEIDRMTAIDNGPGIRPDENDPKLVNIFGANGEKINSEPLTPDDAEEFLKTYVPPRE